jgi:hypothetical protein
MQQLAQDSRGWHRRPRPGAVAARHRGRATRLAAVPPAHGLCARQHHQARHGGEGARHGQVRLPPGRSLFLVRSYIDVITHVYLRLDGIARAEEGRQRVMLPRLVPRYTNPIRAKRWIHS